MEDQTQKKVTVFPTYNDNRNDRQDRQRRCNVTLKRVGVATVTVEENKCLYSSLSYRA